MCVTEGEIIKYLGTANNKGSHVYYVDTGVFVIIITAICIMHSAGTRHVEALMALLHIKHVKTIYY